MDSFFAIVAGVSLLFSWVAETKITALPVPQTVACAARQDFQNTALYNAATLTTATVAPFGRTETGWQIYAPQIAQTIGTPCAPDSKDFAATLASWQARHRLPATGVMTAKSLVAMKTVWQGARPFVAQLETGDCPEAPKEAALSEITAREGWAGKISKVDAKALAELRRMAAAARAEDPRIAGDRQMLTIVSAFRSPEYDAARCKAEGNCNGLVRARCSAHRTGRAFDLYIGALPGHSPVGSDDANRLYQTQTPAYRWLVKNGAHYGFVNYVFEPWHWEWVGKSAPAEHMITAQEEMSVAKPPRIVAATMVSPDTGSTLWARLRTMFDRRGDASMIGASSRR